MLTGLQGVGNRVKHGRVEVRMDGKVGARVVAGGDEDGVALRDSDIDNVDIKRLHVGTVDLDDLHVVPVDVEVHGGERARVDDAETVGLSGLEGERRVLVEADCRRSALG